MQTIKRSIAWLLVLFSTFMVSHAFAIDVDVRDHDATVTASSLNIRSGPGTGYSVIGSRSYGSTVRVTHINGSWSRISWSGRDAYAHSDYLKLMTSSPPITGDRNVTDYQAKVTASSLNIRSGPSTSYSVIGSLAQNSTVTVTHTNGVWRKIQRGGANAYVHSAYIDKTTTGSPGTPAIPPSDYNVSDYNAVVTASSLSVRLGPGTQYTRVGTVYRNRVLRVTHHNGSWARVTWSGNSRAYVHRNYIRRVGSTTPQPVSCDVPTHLNYARSALESANNYITQFTNVLNNPSNAASISSCGTASATAGVIGGGASACMGIDSGGKLGVAGTLGGGMVLGAGGSAGVGVMASNSSIKNIEGPGICAGLSIVPGVGGEVQGCAGLKKSSIPGNCLFVGNGVLQGFLGASAGGEINGSTTLTYTWVRDAHWRDVLEASKRLIQYHNDIYVAAGKVIVNRLTNLVGWSEVKSALGWLASLFPF